MSNLLFLSNNLFNAPLIVPDLQLWLDASDADTITSSGGAVSSWADKSGNSNDATQGTGSAQPLTGINTTNGRNLISFDGVNDTMSIVAASGIDNIWNGGGTVFIAYMPISYGGRILDKRGSPGAGWSIYHNDSSGNESRILLQQDGAVAQYGYRTPNRDIDLNVGNISITKWDSSTPSTPSTFYTNSFTEETGDVLNVGSGASIDDSTEDLFIGNRSDLARAAEINVGEIIVYNRDLTSGETALINAYLMNKWLGFQTPTDIAGLQAWYDTTSDDYLTLDGSAITQFLDRSGNGNDTGVQGTASARPTRTASQINGLQTAVFDGGDTLELPSALYSIPNGENTIFAVSKTNSDTTSQRIVGMSEAGSGRYWIEDNSTSGRVGFANRDAASGTISINDVDKLNANIYVGRRSGTTQALSINGSTESSNTSAVDEPDIDAAYIGSNAGVNTFFTGDIGEILIFNRSLSESERLLILTYLANKWGILAAGNLSLNSYFGETIPFTTTYSGLAFTTDIDMTDYKITPTTTYYVSTTGSSGNDGLTVGTPKASVDQAIALGNASGNPYEIQVAAGTYNRNFRWSTTPTQDCNIIGSGTCILSAEQPLTYTLDSGAYTATRSAVEWVYDANFTDANGTYQRLDLAASVAACQATAGTWFTDGASVWVHTSDSRDLAADPSGIKVYLGVQGGLLESNTTLYLENIDFEGFYRFCLNAKNASSVGGAAIYWNGGSAKYAQEGEVGNGNNYRVDGVDISIIKDVVTADAYLDGFNYHSLNSIDSVCYEIDCESYDCGYSGSASNNASTVHDGSKILRINGIYTGAEGRNIHDIDDGTISVNVGSNVTDSRGSGTSNDINYTNGDGDGGDSKMYLINCKSSGSEVDVRVNSGATTYINTSSGLLSGNNIEDSGAIELLNITSV